MEVYELGELFSERLRKRVQKKLVTAGMGISSEEYLGWGLVFFFFVFLVILPLSPLLSVLASLLVFSVLLYLPDYLSFVRGRKAEHELPFFLRSVVTLMKSGFDALTVLNLLSKGRGVLNKSMLNVLELHRKGIPLGRAFEREADTYVSEKVSRTLRLLGDIVEGGYGVDSLDRYADSLLHLKRIELREFSSKLALYTLLFIAITAVVPSILLIYSLVLPITFGVEVSESILVFILFFVIPLLTLTTLLYIGSRSV